MAQSNSYSRRKLLYGFGLGSLGFATTSWPSLAAAAASGPLANVLTRVQNANRQSGLSDWTAAIGATFFIQDGGRSFAVKLVSVTQLPSPGARPAGLRPGAFAVTFAAPNGPAFPVGNRNYTFVQTNGAPIQLFVSAKSVTGTTGRLIAILN